MLQKPNNQHQHHRRSTRLKGFDYSQPGAYFVTLVTHHRNDYFGAIQDERMILSAIGQIVQEEWRHSAEIRKEIRLWDDEFVVMPNHFHGIVWIVENGDAQVKDETRGATRGTNLAHLLGDNLADDRDRNRRTPVRMPRSLSSMIAGFKSAVTHRAQQELGIVEIWQRNFYEHIIRSPEEFTQLCLYIQNNPQDWGMDQLHL